MPLVSKPISFACRGERLARATSSPDGAVVAPSCPSQGVGPNADAGKEMALCESGKVAWFDIFNTPLVNFSRRNVAGGNEVP
jgi:hypothetical protein